MPVSGKAHAGGLILIGVVVVSASLLADLFDIGAKGFGISQWIILLLGTILVGLGFLKAYGRRGEFASHALAGLLDVAVYLILIVSFLPSIVGATRHLPRHVSLLGRSIENRQEMAYGEKRVRFTRYWDSLLPPGIYPRTIDRIEPNPYIIKHLASPDRVRKSAKIAVIYGAQPGVNLDQPLPHPFVATNSVLDISQWVPVVVFETDHYIAVEKGTADPAGVLPLDGPLAIAKVAGMLP